MLKMWKNVHWLYKVKTLEVSVVRLQQSMDGNGKKGSKVLTIYRQ